MNLGDFDLDKYQKEVGVEFKVIFDVFCSYLLHIYEGKEKMRHIEMLRKDQAIQTIKWLEEHALPFYEEMEEFEKCQRLKMIIDFIKSEKQL